MQLIKYLSCIVFFFLTSRIYSQDQSIYIFDPTGVSTSFQNTLSQLTQDSVFVADSLDDSIFNYEAAFLFFKYPYTMAQTDENIIIDYTASYKPTYIFSQIQPDSNSIALYHHIGLEDIAWFLTSVPIDSVIGMENFFTDGIIIDTNFMSGAIPIVSGELDSILVGVSPIIDINPTYVSTIDTLEVILDFYNLINDEGFLRKVLEYFELIPQPQNVEIQFFPPINTAWIFGGCTGPDLISYNIISKTERDSITIEPEPSSFLFYYDSLGNQIIVDKYYFIVIDSVDQYDYELWFHPTSWPPFNPILIHFDSVFYFQQSSFDIQLVVKLNGVSIDSLSQFFRAEWGLNVDGEDQIPANFSLSQNYPNPFNPSTVISYQLPVIGNVSLKVYDVLGKEIATLVNEEKQHGTYEVEFSAKGGSASGGNTYNLPSGIYFYQLRARDFIETKKMILLK